MTDTQMSPLDELRQRPRAEQTIKFAADPNDLAKLERLRIDLSDAVNADVVAKANGTDTQKKAAKAKLAKATSDAERKEYVQVYEALMIETYVDRFTGYSGETIEVAATRGRPARTTTSILRAGDRQAAGRFLGKVSVTLAPRKIALQEVPLQTP